MENFTKICNDNNGKKKKQEYIVDEFDDIFDISYINSLNIIKSELDPQFFFLSHREKADW